MSESMRGIISECPGGFIGSGIVFPRAALGHSVTVRSADSRTGSKEACRLSRVKVPPGRHPTGRVRNSAARVVFLPQLGQLVADSLTDVVRRHDRGYVSGWRGWKAALGTYFGRWPDLGQTLYVTPIENAFRTRALPPSGSYGNRLMRPLSMMTASGLLLRQPANLFSTSTIVMPENLISLSRSLPLVGHLFQHQHDWPGDSRGTHRHRYKV